MVWYRQRLKTEVQNVIILMENLKDIKELIKQVIKVNNRIYQSKRARREPGKLLQIYKLQAPKQVQ